MAPPHRSLAVRAVVALVAASACGLNPAFDEVAASQSAASGTGGTSGATTAATASTTAGEPTTTGGTTAGIGETSATGTTETGSTSMSGSTSTSTSTTETGGETTATDEGSTGVAGGACPADDPSLIACYAFEEAGDGMMIDGSMYGHHGSRAGAMTIASVDASHGSAIKLDSGSDVHVIDYPAFAPEALTLAAFVYIDQAQVDRGLIDREGSYRLYFNGEAIKCKLYGDSDDDIKVEVAINTWYHVTCTFDGDTLRLHVHGLKFHPPPDEADPSGEHVYTPSEFVIGREIGDDVTKVHGRMDQVMLFDRVLDDQEICDLAWPLCP